MTSAFFLEGVRIKNIRRRLLSRGGGAGRAASLKSCCFCFSFIVLDAHSMLQQSVYIYYNKLAVYFYPEGTVNFEMLKTYFLKKRKSEEDSII